eukprot:gene7848-1054_t
MGKAEEGRQADKALNKHPRRRMYRARAHSNPLSDSIRLEIPKGPSEMDWSKHFPKHFEGVAPDATEKPLVRFADIGCGFGGLLIKLATIYPDTLMVGMELRDKVSLYVKERIVALRHDSEDAGGSAYSNVTCLRTNAMKHLPYFFQKEQLTKVFFLFPDPHFKASNHRRRIINTSLITEYAYLTAPGGMLYTITDVKELGDWMRAKMDAHPMFERISDEELESDPAAGLLTSSSEEAQKVARNQGETYRNVYRRLSAPRVLSA